MCNHREQIQVLFALAALPPLDPEEEGGGALTSYAAPFPNPSVGKNLGLVAWHPRKLVLHTQEKNDSFSQRAAALTNSQGKRPDRSEPAFQNA